MSLAEAEEIQAILDCGLLTGDNHLAVPNQSDHPRYIQVVPLKYEGGRLFTSVSGVPTLGRADSPVTLTLE